MAGRVFISTSGEPIKEMLSIMSVEGDANADADNDANPFEGRKGDGVLGAGDSSNRRGTANLKISFLKKYIHYAKNRIKPILTQEASDVIAEKYVEFREKAKSISEEGRKNAKVFRWVESNGRVCISRYFP